MLATLIAFLVMILFIVNLLALLAWGIYGIFCLVKWREAAIDVQRFNSEMDSIRAIRINEVPEESFPTEFAKRVAWALRLEDPAKWECPICGARIKEAPDYNKPVSCPTCKVILIRI